MNARSFIIDILNRLDSIWKLDIKRRKLLFLISKQDKENAKDAIKLHDDITDEINTKLFWFQGCRRKYKPSNK